MGEGPRRQSAIRWLAAAALFALAFAVRCLPLPGVLAVDGIDGVVFFGNDAYYHMRRIAWTLAHFPRVLDFDPYLAFPYGARAIWTPIFDQAAALLAWPAHAAGGPAAAAKAAVFVPPLLGAATVVGLAALARQLHGGAVGALCGLFAALLSGHVWYSQIGFVDHHVAVTLSAVALLAAAVAFVRASERDAAALLPPALALGLAESLALLLWPGSLLHVALVELALLAHLAAGGGRQRAPQLARMRMAAHALALAIVTPAALSWLSPQWPLLSPTVLSLFQPWLIASLLAHDAVLHALWRKRAAPRAGWSGALAIGASGAAVLGLGLLVTPGLADAAGEAWRWLGRREAFQSVVSESQPLLVVDGAFSAAVAMLRLSAFAFVFPFALCVLAWRARRTPGAAATAVFVTWAIGIAVAALLQRRFVASAALAVAWVMAWSAVEAFRWLRGPRTPGASPPAARRAGLAAAGVAAGALALLWPTLEPHTEHARRVLRVLRGQPLHPGPHERAKHALVRTARWMRTHTPATRGYDDPRERPEYGVLANWDLGHTLLYESRRPQVVGNFGDDLGGRAAALFELHRRYFLSAEPAGARILERLGVRYVVVEGIDDAAREALGPRTLLRRLTADPLDDLRQHRLVYASPAPPGEVPRATYRVFERVAGASVEGRAEPGAALEATLALERDGRPIGRARVRARADAHGRYRLELAQSREDAAGRPWQLRAGARTAAVAVDAADLRTGASLRGPDLREPPGAAGAARSGRGSGGGPAAGAAPGLPAPRSCTTSPATSTASTCEVYSNGSPSKSTRSATLPASTDPKSSSMPSSRAASSVIARSAASEPSPFAAAIAASKSTMRVFGT